MDGLRHLAHETPRALRNLNEVDAGLRQLLGKGARENRIGIVVIVREPVERSLPRSGREHREYALGQLRHRRKAAAAGHRAGARALERVVAAGVEHQNGGAHFLVLQSLDDAVGENGSVAHQLFLALGRSGNVGRQQEILPGNFKPVAGVEEERGVARPDRPVEREQRLAERLPVLVFRHHDAETELLQCIAHGAGVVDRLLQLRDVPVVVIADNERDALFRLCWRSQCRQPRSHAAGQYGF